MSDYDTREPHPVWDTADVTSFGWIAVIHGLSPGWWVRARTASAITGLSPRTLRHLARHGIISRLHRGKRSPYRYLEQELGLVLVVTDGEPTAEALNRYIRLWHAGPGTIQID